MLTHLSNSWSKAIDATPMGYHLKNLPNLEDIVNGLSDTFMGVADVEDLEAPKALQPNTYYQSKAWLAKTAATKQAELWNEVINDKAPGAFPSAAELIGIFAESMEPSFSTAGDSMAKGLIYGTRTKYIHSVGVVGKVKFVPTKANTYSNAMGGSDYGLIRLSSAAAPTADGSQPLAPGLGLKFLRDGMDSANLVAMYGVAGTPGDWNFFSKDFYNHIGAATGAALEAVAYKFSSATSYIQEVALKDMAQSDTYPFSLRFVPHSDVHSLFPTELTGAPMMYVDQLQTVPAGSTLYDVMAYDKPQELGGVETNIGSLVLDGVLTSSKWGDQNLFFRHEKMDDDLKAHPEWAPYLAKYGGSKCPYSLF